MKNILISLERKYNYWEIKKRFNVISLALSKEIYNVPIPSRISYMWNMGSLLGCCLVIQIVRGLFLAMHYQASVFLSFDSVIKIINDVNGGWAIRFLHANTASAFFICLYLHVGRGLYYGSYRLVAPWVVGTLIILLIMATAFLGYVLPWGQMSYWGATVITNLLSALPYIGKFLVEWVWGGFSVSDPTLIRIFSIHFVLPFLALGLVLLHLIRLHLTGRRNPLGLGSDRDKVRFHPYFFIKDLIGILIFTFIMIGVVFQIPAIFIDPDNFMPANPINTPPHIQPEWYFLFAYAILRSIPRKLGGVVALVMSILILLWLPLSKLPAGSFIVKYFTIVQVIIFLTLTWLGAVPAESPYVVTSQVCAFIYFSVFILWMTR